MKRHLISFAITFVSTFLGLLGTAIAVLTPEAMLMPETWTVTFVGGLLMSALRGAIKIASEKFLLQ